MLGKISFRHVVILGLLNFLSLSGISQQLRVVDKISRTPIAHVNIYTKNNAVLTNQNGYADLSNFKPYKKLNFQHSSYQGETILVKNIKNNLIIGLAEKVIKIEEVVISASKWEEDKSEIPNKIASISGKDISFENPQTSADLLESSGQVFVQKSQLGGGSPMIRGFAANSILIVVDGVRMNNAIFRSGNLQNIISVDPNIQESAEVIFGPGSVIYGSDALGGVMDFHSKTPKFSNTEKTMVGGSIFSRFSSANKEKTGHFDINLATKKFSSLTSISFSDFGDLKTGSNRTDKFPDFGKRQFYIERVNGEDQIITNKDVNLQIPSGYSQLNVLQKFKYRISDVWDLAYTLNYSSTSNIPRYDRLIQIKNNEPINAEWYYGPQKWLLTSLQATTYGKKRLYDQGRFILAYQDIEESRNSRIYRATDLKRRTENVKIYSFNADFDKEVNDKNHLFYGLEFLYNDVASSAFKENIDNGTISPLSTRYPSGGSDYSSFAAYLSHKLKFNDKWILNSGLRFSQVNLSAKLKDNDELDFDFERLSIKNGAVNGSLGLVYKPKESWQLNFVASTGFRAPNIDDVGKVFSGASDDVIVPNPELKPEVSYNTEISINKVFNEKVKLSLTVFNSFLRNAMVRSDFTFNGQDSIVFDGTKRKVLALTNTGKAQVFGGSINILAALTNRLSFSSAITITKGEDKVNHEPLRHTTPLFGQSALVYNHKKIKASFIVKYNGKRKFEDLAPSEKSKIHLYTADGSLAWFTLNLKTAYQLSNLLQVNGGVENILDKHYRPYSSGISASGRNFYLALRATF